MLGVPEEQAPTDSKRVLVVINQNSPDSQTVGSYYTKLRKIPHGNVLFINTVTTDNIPAADFDKNIKDRVRAAIQKNKFAIDFIVLTKGVPIRIGDNGGYSTDAHLAAMDLPIKAIEKPEMDAIRGSVNPYFKKNEPFSSRKYGFYLVTRLDGYDVEHVKKLVDNSLAAKPQKGPFFFDAAGNRKDQSYGEMQKSLFMAEEMLKSKGFEAKTDATDDFALPEGPVAGYASWGSNDGKFSQDVYRKIRFKPGALVETFVSTSGRTFSRTTGGQSLIADLIESGVTGVKGYVSEPFTFALARPEILFDRYTSGYNLAESFYMASLVLKWKDVVIGDPLCAPYAKK
jgi:uncharacterized protein (TIGR03790 family)